LHAPDPSVDPEALFAGPVATFHAVRIGQRLREVLNRAGAPVAAGSIRRARTGLPAPAIAGVDPWGRPATVSTEHGRVGLVFLTSSCAPCQNLWGEAVAGQVALVTPSPSTESRRRVGQLAPPGVKVVMSSEAWSAYGVTRAPWLVIVDGGIVVGDGPAPRTWDAIDA